MGASPNIALLIANLLNSQTKRGALPNEILANLDPRYVTGPERLRNPPMVEGSRQSQGMEYGGPGAPIPEAPPLPPPEQPDPNYLAAQQLTQRPQMPPIPQRPPGPPQMLEEPNFPPPGIVDENGYAPEYIEQGFDEIAARQAPAPPPPEASAPLQRTDASGAIQPPLPMAQPGQQAKPSGWKALELSLRDPRTSSFLLTVASQLMQPLATGQTSTMAGVQALGHGFNAMNMVSQMQYARQRQMQEDARKQTELESEAALRAAQAKNYEAQAAGEPVRLDIMKEQNRIQRIANSARLSLESAKFGLDKEKLTADIKDSGDRIAVAQREVAAREKQVDEMIAQGKRESDLQPKRLALMDKQLEVEGLRVQQLMLETLQSGANPEKAIMELQKFGQSVITGAISQRWPEEDIAKLTPIIQGAIALGRQNFLELWGKRGGAGAGTGGQAGTRYFRDKATGKTKEYANMPPSTVPPPEVEEVDAFGRPLSAGAAKAAPATPGAPAPAAPAPVAPPAVAPPAAPAVTPRSPTGLNVPVAPTQQATRLQDFYFDPAEPPSVADVTRLRLVPVPPELLMALRMEKKKERDQRLQYEFEGKVAPPLEYESPFKVQQGPIDVELGKPIKR